MELKTLWSVLSRTRQPTSQRLCHVTPCQLHNLFDICIGEWLFQWKLVIPMWQQLFSKLTVGLEMLPHTHAIQATQRIFLFRSIHPSQHFHPPSEVSWFQRSNQPGWEASLQVDKVLAKHNGQQTIAASCHQQEQTPSYLLISWRRKKTRSKIKHLNNQKPEMNVMQVCGIGLYRRLS